MSYNDTFGFKTNNFYGLSLKEILLRVEIGVETEIPDLFKVITLSNLKKKITGLKLKKEFQSFSRNNNTLSEKEKCICFVKDYISKLYAHINKWSEIFISEELDKTKEKHRRHLKEIIPYVNRINEIEFALRVNKNYGNKYFSQTSAKEFFSQHNLM